MQWLLAKNDSADSGHLAESGKIIFLEREENEDEEQREEKEK